MPVTTEPLVRFSPASAEHLHGTLPPEAVAAVMAPLMPPSHVPDDADFEAWEDGAYVLAYVRRNDLL